MSNEVALESDGMAAHSRGKAVSYLHGEIELFHGTGGRSQENQPLGFCHAFMDGETGIVYAPDSGMDWMRRFTCSTAA